MGAGDFTIEFWNKRVISSSSGDTTAGLVFYGPNATSNVSWKYPNGSALDYFLADFGFALYIQSVWSYNCNVVFWNGADDSLTSFGQVSSINWHHVAIVRESGTIKVYWDGIERVSKPNTQDYSVSGAAAAGNLWGSASALFGIGDSNYSTGLDCFNGYIDDLQVSNIARYTSNFTPATTRIIPDNYTTSFDNFDDIVPTYSGIIQYTGKTANTFTGCSIYRGSNSITSGSEIIPFSPL